MKRSSLDQWILDKHGLDTFDREAVRSWQLARIRELIAYVKEKSRLYGGLYADLDPPESLEAFSTFPTIGSHELTERGRDMLCVSQSQIDRIVTLQTSGTTQKPKRVFFTRQDIDLTLDFFQHGMKTLCGPGDRALILFPAKTPDSVGALLSTALRRLGLKVHCSGVEEAEDVFTSFPIDLVCGPASWVVEAAEKNSRFTVRSVLTSSEVLDRPMRGALQHLWGAEVFDHFGMTETGLGGAVECEAHEGMHIRENDLYFETLDANGRPPPLDHEGELVVTTLTRRGMPFIRYRTGDRGVMTERACLCGSRIQRIMWARRMERVT